MSVINKMLQDLDARGLQAVRSDLSDIGSVPDATRRLEMRRLIALLVLALVALAGLAAWYFNAAPVVPVTSYPLPELASVAQPDPLANAAPLVQPVQLADVAMVAPLAVASSAQPAPEPKVVAVAPASERPASGQLVRVSNRSNVEQLGRPQRPVTRVVKADVAVRTPVAEPRMRNASTVGSVADDVLQMKQANPRQEAENDYRKALGLIQEGRVTAGISALEQVLRIDPRHDAARQTLIGLLLENKQQDEAMQQLAQALALDPGQPALAMTLARLQVEKGGPALQTLQRSLPHATERADYLSFVAALLQRERRHKEAIEHYQAALRLSPGNGLWWMGLGISLQADDRLPDAKVAFQRAKASGSLESELSSFVDKKLQQLAR
jgi:MSHA biogenesis protein MshN